MINDDFINQINTKSKIMMKRKFYIFFITCVVLLGCNHTNNECPKIIPIQRNSHPGMIFKIDTLLEKRIESSLSLLGCGYDCKLSPIKGNAYVRNRVIDVNRLLNGEGYDYVKHFFVKLPSFLEINKATLYESGYTNSIANKTLDKHIKDISSANWVKTHLNNTQLNLFTLVIDSLNNRNFRDGYFTYEYFRPTRTFTLPEVYPDYLCYFLSDNFIKDLYTKSADDIVKIYGTHVLTDITLGGWISVSSIVRLSRKSYEEDVTTEMNLYYNHFHNSSYSANGNEYFENCDSLIFYIHLTGGNQSTIKINNNQILGFQDWMQSINSQNEQIIDINNTSTMKTFLLSDFILDIKKRKEIEDAIIRYCN